MKSATQNANNGGNMQNSINITNLAIEIRPLVVRGDDVAAARTLVREVFGAGLHGCVSLYQMSILLDEAAEERGGIDAELRGLWAKLGGLAVDSIANACGASEARGLRMVLRHARGWKR